MLMNCARLVHLQEQSILGDLELKKKKLCQKLVTFMVL